MVHRTWKLLFAIMLMLTIACACSYTQYKKPSGKNSLLQILAAWKLIRSENGAPIITPILLEDGRIVPSSVGGVEYAHRFPARRMRQL